MAAALLACTVGGCGASRARLPEPQIVEVAMSEYRFDYRPPQAAGRTLLRVRNDGRLAHNLVLIPLDDSIPPLDQQLRGSDRLIVQPVASLPERAAGQSGTFAVDLERGRYGFVCFVQDADGVQHARKGMSSEFRIR